MDEKRYYAKVRNQEPIELCSEDYYKLKELLKNEQYKGLISLHHKTEEADPCGE